MLCVKLKKPTLDLSKAKVLKHITNSKLENIAVWKAFIIVFLRTVCLKLRKMANKKYTYGQSLRLPTI